jgi:uncharacterized membrane protein YhaH (DUF805 family)
MPYDPGRQNAQLLLRAIRGTSDFSGRSRRSEWLYYAIATGLVRTVFVFAAGLTLPFEAAALFGLVLWLLLSIPVPALFVRRMHDQGRSGWWALLLVVPVIAAVYSDLQYASDASNGLDALAGLGPGRWAPTLISLAILVFILWPGSEGANAYGEDPRLEE